MFTAEDVRGRSSSLRWVLRLAKRVNGSADREGACSGARSSARTAGQAWSERGASSVVVVLNTIFPIGGHLAGD